MNQLLKQLLIFLIVMLATAAHVGHADHQMNNDHLEQEDKVHIDESFELYEPNSSPMHSPEKTNTTELNLQPSPILVAGNQSTGITSAIESSPTYGFKVNVIRGQSQQIKVGENISFEVEVHAESGIHSLNAYIQRKKIYHIRKQYGSEPTTLIFRGELFTIAKNEQFLSPGEYNIKLKIVDGNKKQIIKNIGTVKVYAHDNTLTNDIGTLLIAHQNHMKSNIIDSEYIKKNNTSLPDPPPWANSEAGISTNVPWPFKALTRDGYILKLWGRSIELNNFGLPKSITSKGHELLANPMNLLVNFDSSTKNINAVKTKTNNPSVKTASLPQASTSPPINHPTFTADNQLEKPPKLKITNLKADRISWSSSSVYRDHEIVIDGELKFDGFMNYKIRIIPKMNLTLKKFIFQIPFKLSAAKYLNHLTIGTQALSKYGKNQIFEKGYGGSELKNGYKKLPFSFQYTVQNEETGLLFTVETEKTWRVTDRNHMYSLNRTSKAAIFQARFVDHSTIIDSNVFEVEFALQILPVKPFPTWGRIKEFNAMQWPSATNIYARGFHTEESAKDTLWFQNSINEETSLSAWDKATENGLKTMILHQGWSELQGYPGSLDKKNIDAVKRIVRDAHARNIKIVIYIGLEISKEAPEWKDYADQFVKIPLRRGRSRGAVHALRPDGGTKVYSNFVVHRLKELIQETDIDGVFLDLLPEPQICMNAKHGHGYRSEDGSYHGTLPVFENRHMLKRIYSLFHQSPKTDGIVIGHVSGPFRPGHGFLDYVIAGETEVFKRKKKPNQGLSEIMNLTEFRAVYNQNVWGVPLVWLTKPSRGGFNMKQNGAVTLLHNVLQRTQWPHFISPDFDQVINNPIDDVYDEWKVWQTFTSIGLDRGEWHPYWLNRHMVSGMPENVNTSFWVIPGEKILAVVSNLSQRKTTFPISYDFNKLGFTTLPTQIFDPISNKKLSLNQRKVILEIPAESYQLLIMQW